MTANKRKMIAVFGGTFDPVHFGHLRVAVELKELLSLEQLRFLPCHNPPHRGVPETASEHRLAMVQLALQGDDSLLVDDRELKREGLSYTVKTLESLREELGNDVALCLAMGADAFLGIEKWHRWQDLLALAHIVVMTRPGWQMPSQGIAGELLRNHVADKVEQLHVEAAGKILPLVVTALEISATQIRKSIAAGRSPRFLLPDAVLEYIRQHRLYANVDH